MFKLLILIGTLGLTVVACTPPQEQTMTVDFSNKIKGSWLLAQATVNNQNSDLLAGIYVQFSDSEMTSNLISLLKNSADSVSQYSIQKDSTITLNLVEPVLKIVKLEKENMTLNFNYNKNVYNLFFNKQ
jgi:hypothetical protein